MHRYILDIVKTTKNDQGSRASVKAGKTILEKKDFAVHSVANIFNFGCETSFLFLFHPCGQLIRSIQKQLGQSVSN